MHLGNMFQSLKPLSVNQSTGFTTLKYHTVRSTDLPGSSAVKKQVACNAGNVGSIPWVWEKPQRRKWLPPPVFLPGKYIGQRSLVGCYSCLCQIFGHNLVTKQQQMLSLGS